MMVIQELVLGAPHISTVEKQELNTSWPLGISSKMDQ